MSKMFFFFKFVSVICVACATQTQANRFRNIEYQDFCKLTFNGSSSLNTTNVLATYAIKYNFGCGINNNINNKGDEHYSIEIALYGQRIIKAWGSKFDATEIRDHTKNTLNKSMSFGWVGASKLICSMKKYNSIQNKYIYCVKILSLNITEPENYLRKFFTKMSTTTKSKISKFTTINSISTSLKSNITENRSLENLIAHEFPHGSIKKPNAFKLAVHEVPIVNENERQFIKKKFYNSLIVMSILSCCFLSLIALTLYFNHKLKKNLFSSLDFEAHVCVPENNVRQLISINRCTCEFGERSHVETLEDTETRTNFL